MLRMQSASSDATAAVQYRAMRVRTRSKRKHVELLAFSGSLCDARCAAAQWLRPPIFAVRVCCLQRFALRIHDFKKPSD